MAGIRTLRSPLAVTLAVWKALFLREAVSRLAQDRISWLWIVIEPLAHLIILIYFFSIGFRTKVIAGADLTAFLILGILGFFVLRNIMNRSMDAIDKSEALFIFRQVKPIDAVLVRAPLETLLTGIMLLVMLVGAALFGHPIVPADPLGALLALGALALGGLGLGLVFSVVGNLIPEAQRVVRLMLTPLYLLSAVIYPSIAVPRSMRDALLLNPILHGVESLRIAFMPAYHVPPGIDLDYLTGFGLATVFLGLALHVRYQSELKAK